MDVDRIRRDIPLLRRAPDERIVYLDNACMTLKPQPVIDAVLRYYNEFPACGERSPHRLGNRVTIAVDEARAKMGRLVGAPPDSRIAFTKNTTEAINQVVWGSPLDKGDVVLTSDKEHNSNLVPWKRRAKADGIVHDWFRTNDDGTFDEEAFKTKVSDHRGRLKLVSLVHTSNLDGVTFPLDLVTELAHDAGARVLVDGAQSVPHMPVDVARLGIDYLAWSVHKMMGPTGVGCLWGTDEALAALEPHVMGGNTVADSRLDGYEALDAPHVLEAGLQDYAGIIGAGAAADYLMDIGLDEIHAHDIALNDRLTKGFTDRGLGTVHGPAEATQRAGVFPFSVAPLDSHDVALYLDEAARIAIRSGAHCVHAWLNARGLSGWARASVYAYNTIEECDLLVDTLAELAARMERAA